MAASTSAEGITLDSGGTLLTFEEQGTYVIVYTITPASGANINATAAIGFAGGGVLANSVRAMTTNNSPVTATIIANLGAGQQIFLGVSSSEAVTLQPLTGRAVNAGINAFRIR